MAANLARVLSGVRRGWWLFTARLLTRWLYSGYKQFTYTNVSLPRQAEPVAVAATWHEPGNMVSASPGCRARGAGRTYCVAADTGGHYAGHPPRRAALLADAFRECTAVIKASGGEFIPYQPGTLLLAWPAAGPPPPLAALYAQLRASVRRLASSPALGLGGAAGLGWATQGAERHYNKASLREVAGILPESQQLGSELLLMVALHRHLATTAGEQYTLHVAFEVPGHRYPATLYRVAG